MVERFFPSRTEKAPRFAYWSRLGNGLGVANLHSIVPLIFLLAFLQSGASSDAAESGVKYTGQLSCQSSSCHGGAAPKSNQNLVWNKFDFHSRAFAILTTSRSMRIAESLKIGVPSESGRCTICHSPFQAIPSSQLAKTAHTDEGVSCESCHGGASRWIRSHTRPDFTHQDRVNDGMRELKGAYARANVCVACHETIDQAILDAGHPPLVFELDSQLVSEPPHWRENDSWAGPRAWLTGQAVALREQSWKISIGEGSLPRYRALKWFFEQASRHGLEIPTPPSETAQDYVQTQHWADAVARSAQKMKWGESECMKLLKGLAGVDATSTGDIPEQVNRAEVLVQALDRLTVALKKNGKRIEGIDSALNTLFADVRDPHAFDTAQFAQHRKGVEAVPLSGTAYPTQPRSAN